MSLWQAAGCFLRLDSGTGVSPVFWLFQPGRRDAGPTQTQRDSHCGFMYENLTCELSAPPACAFPTAPRGARLVSSVPAARVNLSMVVAVLAYASASGRATEATLSAGFTASCRSRSLLTKYKLVYLHIIIIYLYRSLENQRITPAKGLATTTSWTVAASPVRSRRSQVRLGSVR